MNKKMHVVTLLVMVGMASGCSTGMVYPSQERIRIDVDGVIRRVEVKTPRTDLLVSGSDLKPQTSAPIPSKMEVPTPEPEITTEPEPTKKPERETRLPETVVPESEPTTTKEPPEPAVSQEPEAVELRKIEPRTNQIPSLPIQEPEPETHISIPVPYPSRPPKDGELYSIIDIEVISAKDREVRLILRADDGNLIAYSQRYTDEQIFESVRTRKIKQVRWRSVPEIKRLEADETWGHFLIPHYRGPLTPGKQ
jgi:hypothetical protein